MYLQYWYMYIASAVMCSRIQFYCLSIVKTCIKLCMHLIKAEIEQASLSLTINICIFIIV